VARVTFLSAALTVVCSTALSTPLSAPLPETGPIACKRFLSRTQPRVQCGPSCATHAVSRFLGAEVGTELSVPYLLLSSLANDSEFILKEPERAFSHAYLQVWEKRTDVSSDLGRVLMSGADYGVLPSSRFPTLSDQVDFVRQFGLPLTEFGVRSLRRRFIGATKRAMRCTSARSTGCERRIEGVRTTAQKIFEFQRRYREEGVSFWNRQFSKLYFEYYLVDSGGSQPFDASSYNDGIKSWAEKNGIHLSIEAKNLMRTEVETALLESLKDGGRVVVSLNPKPLIRWPVNAPKLHAILLHDQEGEWVTVEDSGGPAPNLWNFLWAPLDLRLFQTGEIERRKIADLLPYIRKLLLIKRKSAVAILPER
jgi:hypothetical protein